MPVKNFVTDFGAQSGKDVYDQCQAVSADILNNNDHAYKLIVPAGDYYLRNTWEIPGDSGRTVIIEAEVGPGRGSVFHPHSTFRSVVKLGTNYLPIVRREPGLHYSFTSSREPSWGAPAYDAVSHKHLDYRPLIRLRAMGEGSALRGIVITGRDENSVARLGKGLWVDVYFHPDDSGYDEAADKINSTFSGSNGLLIEGCKVNNVYAVLEKANEKLVHVPAANQQRGKHYYPWLPAIAVQVGSMNTDGATRQVSNVRFHRSYVFGGLGSVGAPLFDPFEMRTDLGIYFDFGNMKNYTVSECNIGFCQFGIKTAGSGYTNVTDCDFAANGSLASGWGDEDGADLLIPQAQVNVIGCGSEGSRRFVQGAGAPQGFGGLNIDACYWDGILPRDIDDGGEGVGYVLRNLNQATYVRGLRVTTGGGSHVRAGKAAVQINFNKFHLGSLVLVNSHLDGVADYLGDPLIYDYNNLLPPKLEELAGYADAEDARIFVQNCTSRGYVNGEPGPIVPLQNYDYSGVKRIGGHSVKVTSFVTPGSKPLAAWHHTVVVSASAGDVTLTLPGSGTCRGREYVIKRMDETPPAPGNVVQIILRAQDKIESGLVNSLQLQNLECCRVVSAGERGWMITGK